MIKIYIIPSYILYNVYRLLLVNNMVGLVVYLKYPVLVLALALTLALALALTLTLALALILALALTWA